MAGTVELTIRDRIARVALCNPSLRNALDDATRRSLLAALKRVAGEARVRAVVLRGSDGAFCAGGELRSMPTDPTEVDSRLGEMHQIVRCLVEMDQPVIAVVEGPAFGSGLSLAVACDYVIASPEAVFGCSFGRVGLVPDTGLGWTLPRRVGLRAARRIMLFGETITAAAAEHIGLVDEVVETDELEVRCGVIARSLVERSPLAAAGVKHLSQIINRTFQDFLAAEMAMQKTLLASDDFKNARDAFLARSSPVFTGR